MNEKLAERIRKMLAKEKGLTFTLESGKGATYKTSDATLYAHGTYGKSSVLAGQPSRTWLDSWEKWEEARAEMKELAAVVPGFSVDEWQGSSHISPEVLCDAAGLHDEEGTDEYFTSEADILPRREEP